MHCLLRRQSIASKNLRFLCPPEAMLRKTKFLLICSAKPLGQCIAPKGHQASGNRFLKMPPSYIAFGDVWAMLRKTFGKQSSASRLHALRACITPVGGNRSKTKLKQKMCKKKNEISDKKCTKKKVKMLNKKNKKKYIFFLFFLFCYTSGF